MYLIKLVKFSFFYCYRLSDWFWWIKIITRYRQCIRGFGLGVEISEFFDVQLPVAVFIEFPQQYPDSPGRKAVRRILKYARRFVQRDESVLVMVIFFELGYQLNLPINNDDVSSPPSYPGPDYGIGRCLGPTMSKGTRKMAAKYLNIR